MPPAGWGFFPHHGWAPAARRLYFKGTGLPMPLNARLAAEADRVASGESTAADAAARVWAGLAQDPARWLRPSAPIACGIHVLGAKGGQPAVASATIPGRWTAANWYLLTGAPLIAAARRVWRGLVPQKGVLLPEAVFSLTDFEPEVAALLPELPGHGRLFVEDLTVLG